MGNRLVQCSLSSPDRQGGHLDPGAVEKLHDMIEAPALLTHQVLLRDSHVFENHFPSVGCSNGELSMEGAGLVPGSVGLHNDRA